jgi:hypothetical protein
MTLIDGWGYEHFHASGMLYVEATIGGLGLVLFLTVTSLVSARARWQTVA